MAVLLGFLVLLLGAGGGGYWWFNYHVPDQQADTMRRTVQDVGAPVGFGPDTDGNPSGEPVEDAKPSGHGLYGIHVWYALHCPGGRCPTDPTVAITTWATRIGAAQLMSQFQLAAHCSDIGGCQQMIRRDGMVVELELKVAQDMGSPGPGIKYGIMVFVSLDV